MLLHHFSFKGPVRAAQFSPDGEYIACAVGKILQVVPPHPSPGLVPQLVYMAYINRGLEGGPMTALSTLPLSPLRMDDQRQACTNRRSGGRQAL